MLRMPFPKTEQEFWERCQTDDPWGCWEWRGSVDKDGFGYLKWENRPRRSHRHAFELWHKRAIPQGFQIALWCENKKCCNPCHMIQVPTHWARVKKAQEAAIVRWETQEFKVGDRRCTKCGYEGGIDEYVKDARYNFGRKNLCRRCWAEGTRGRMLKMRNKKRKALLAYKDRPCADCGGMFPHYVMDLDHVRGEKRFALSAAIGKNRPMEEFLEELKKCDVVCANCHRVRSHARGHLYKRSWSDADTDLPEGRETGV